MMVDFHFIEIPDYGQRCFEPHHWKGKAGQSQGADSLTEPLFERGFSAKNAVLASTASATSHHHLSATPGLAMSWRSPWVCPSAVVQEVMQPTTTNKNALLQQPAASTLSDDQNQGRKCCAPLTASCLRIGRSYSGRAWQERNTHDHVWPFTAAVACRKYGTNSANHFRQASPTYHADCSKR